MLSHICLSPQQPGMLQSEKLREDSIQKALSQMYGQNTIFLNIYFACGGSLDDVDDVNTHERRDDARSAPVGLWARRY